ncbi:MAG: DUF262 domain-containing protein [Actinomycetales bacterium]|nr:DUF262 domain-containing protein [Actinomycetales bacterium]
MAKNEISNVSIRTPTLGELRDAQTKEANGEFFIMLPRFQRGVVWKIDQKKRLIDSIFNGYPVGSLLGFVTGAKEESGYKPRDIIQLVDGLQRTTSIVEYLREPLLYSPMSVLFDDDKIHKLSILLEIESAPEADHQIKLALESWAAETKVGLIPQGFSTGRLTPYLASIPLLADREEGSLAKNDELTALLEKYLQDILNDIKAIENVRVPLISYMGPQENVPEIFDRINTQGIKLSKYEKFAAAWVTNTTHISNEAIRNAVEAKYQALRDAGYEVTDLGANEKIPLDGFNLFEYLLGLGKVLSEKYEFLFPDSSKADDSPAAGFVIATIAHGLKTNQMASLATHLSDLAGPGKILKLDAFERAVFGACDTLQDALRRFLRLNLNSQTSTTRFLPHSQNQIISMVVRLMLEQNDWSTWEERKGKQSDALANNLPAFYLIDILRGHWSGSGDTKLWDVCWDADTMTSAGPVSASTHYLDAPNEETWRSTLRVWHGDQLKKNQTVRPNVSSETKVFLKFVYANKVTVMADEAKQFDLEHIYPVDVLVKAISVSGSGEGWPVSTAGNLSILPARINRIKGVNMLGDYLKTPKGSHTSVSELEDLQRYVIFPEINDLIRPEVFDKAVYIQFCQGRFEYLIDAVMDAVGAKP